MPARPGSAPLGLDHFQCILQCMPRTCTSGGEYWNRGQTGSVGRSRHDGRRSSVHFRACGPTGGQILPYYRFWAEFDGDASVTALWIEEVAPERRGSVHCSGPVRHPAGRPLQPRHAASSPGVPAEFNDYLPKDSDEYKLLKTAQQKAAEQGLEELSLDTLPTGPPPPKQLPGNKSKKKKGNKPEVGLVTSALCMGACKSHPPQGNGVGQEPDVRRAAALHGLGRGLVGGHGTHFHRLNWCSEGYSICKRQ